MVNVTSVLPWTIFIPLEGAGRVCGAVVRAYGTEDNSLVALGDATLMGNLGGYGAMDIEGVRDGLRAVVFIARIGGRDGSGADLVGSYSFAVCTDGSHRLVAAGIGDRRAIGTIIQRGERECLDLA